MADEVFGGLIFCLIVFIVAWIAQCFANWLTKIDRRRNPPLCEHCKYAEYVQGWTALDGSHLFCKRYKSPVNDLTFMCWNVRDNENWCGYMGKGFEKK